MFKDLPHNMHLTLAAIIGVLALAALAHALAPGSERAAQPSEDIGGKPTTQGGGRKQIGNF